jgi:hypothetical protein
MKKIDLGQTVNTLANVGVIAGIVFLAMELQQNNELMAADTRATVISMMTEMWSTAIEEEDLGPIFIKDRNDEPLTEVETLRANANWIRALLNADYVFRDAPELFPQQVAYWKQAYSVYGSLRRLWSSGSSDGAATTDMYSPEFVEYMTENVFTP